MNTCCLSYLRLFRCLVDIFTPCIKRIISDNLGFTLLKVTEPSLVFTDQTLHFVCCCHICRGTHKHTHTHTHTHKHTESSRCTDSDAITSQDTDLSSRHAVTTRSRRKTKFRRHIHVCERNSYGFSLNHTAF